MLGLNINEILLDDNLLSDEYTLSSIFFDCQCAIFLIDVTSEESFSLVKQLITRIIINLNCQYLNKLLVINKIDNENNWQISKTELENYISEFNTDFEYLLISLKTKVNLEQLWDKVYECVNKNTSNIPNNLLTEKIETFSGDIDTLMNAERTINIILIGDSGVGKTNLFIRYFKNKFEPNFISTIGLEKQSKFFKYKNKFYRLNISDTAGQERFRSLPLTYYQNADGALLLYDITDKDSFENVRKWMDDLNNNKRVGCKQTIYLIGNKIDLPERAVTQEDAKELAESLELQYYEMSAKANININEIVARLFISCLDNLMESENGFKINKKKKNKKKNKNCC